VAPKAAAKELHYLRVSDQKLFREIGRRD